VRGKWVVLGVVLGSLSACTRPDEGRSNDRPGATVGAMAAASASASAAASVSASPGGAPVASWTDARVVAGLAERCDFDPGKLAPEEQARRFGHAFEEGETISCEGPRPEQSCAYDPCREGEFTSKCEDECIGSCRGCAAGCASTCDGCRAGCKGDAACERRCAETTASCRQACVSRGETCRSADCAAVEKKCADDLAADLIKSGCVARLETVYGPCVAKCEDSSFGECGARCAEKAKPCDARLFFSPRWLTLARFGPRWKKDRCDARCSAYDACAKACQADGDKDCRSKCLRALKPCDWLSCPGHVKG
jgi:hypothetical protein